MIHKKDLAIMIRYVEETLGINVPIEKYSIFEYKVERVMRRNHISKSSEMLEEIINESGSVVYYDFIDTITTHKTDFFREKAHFAFMKDHLDEILSSNHVRQEQAIRVWSAACSTGEEAYTIGMVLNEWVPANVQIKILATDVSDMALRRASKGYYNKQIVTQVGKVYYERYFSSVSEDMAEVTSQLKSQISFRRFNLMAPFPFKKQFDIIFLRNVMIYFNLETQMKVLRKMYDALSSEGYLIIGLSEGLTTKTELFEYVAPSIYKKNLQSRR